MFSHNNETPEPFSLSSFQEEYWFLPKNRPRYGYDWASSGIDAIVLQSTIPLVVSTWTIMASCKLESVGSRASNSTGLYCVYETQIDNNWTKRLDKNTERLCLFLASPSNRSDCWTNEWANVWETCLIVSLPIPHWWMAWRERISYSLTLESR